MTKTDLSLLLSAAGVFLALQLSPALTLATLVAILVITALANPEP
jgi:hypothetical protein